MADNKLLRDIRGSVLVESTILIPIFLLLVLGTIDATYMFYDWSLANKAAYKGARAAVVSNPVAWNSSGGVVNLTYTTTVNTMGTPCLNSANCPSVGPIICTSTGCTPSTYGFNSTNFTNILNQMQGIFPRLQATNVAISYQTNGSGFVGQSYYGNTTYLALPMNVTVQIQCMPHQFYFLSVLRGWAFSTPPKDALGNTCPGTGPWIPRTATTMQSESLYTD